MESYFGGKAVKATKILICGAGAIGGNLAGILVADTRGEYEITVLDFDVVQERNIRASTQFYLPEQIGTPKTEALQYNVYKFFGRQVNFINEKLTSENVEKILSGFDLIIDAFDNVEARKLVAEQRGVLPKRMCLHVGFSDVFTFSTEWQHKGYEIPSSDPKIDICEMEGASSFVRLVASTASLVIQRALAKGEFLDVVGNKFSVRTIT